MFTNPFFVVALVLLIVSVVLAVVNNDLKSPANFALWAIGVATIFIN